MIGVDKKALAILLNFFPPKDFQIWNTKHINNSEFEYAKSKGLMFDPVFYRHDDAVKELIVIKSKLSQQFITDLFVASLSSRHLLWRSGLSAYSISKNFPTHNVNANSNWAEFGMCNICGDFVQKEERQINLNMYNLTRVSTGGFDGRKMPIVLNFYLNETLKLKPVKPSSFDIAILYRIFDCISDTSLKSVIELEIALSKIPEFKSNKKERKALIETLGYCSVLETKDHKGYLKQFINADDTDYKPNRTGADKWAYPAVWWTGIDGVNMEAWDYWFGEYKL